MVFGFLVVVVLVVDGRLPAEVVARTVVVIKVVLLVTVVVEIGGAVVG